MKRENEITNAEGRAEKGIEAAPMDAELDSALKDFRASVHAWSEDVFHRPRLVVDPAPGNRAWRWVLGWALGVVLAAGIFGVGLEERQHQREVAERAHQQELQRQKQLMEQRAREADELLAKVDSDVSREVPDAMEPLAQLMAEDDSK